MIHANIIPLLQTLNAQKHSQPTAAGLLKQMLSFRFFAALCVFHDVLPILASLCLTFQRPDLNVCEVLPLVQGTIDTVRTQVDTPGLKYRSLPSLLNDIEAAGFKVDNRYREGFDETIRKPFLMGLRDQLLMLFPDTAILRAFSVLFDPRSYPTQGSELKQYGDEEIKLLSAHFGAVTVSRDPEYFDFVDPLHAKGFRNSSRSIAA